jgi:hypothetical protein
MHLVEFKLSMPGRASWNGAWSGEDRNYAIVRELSDADLSRLFGFGSDSFDLTKCQRVWTHRWSDGWVAQVTARVVPSGEALKKSDGFCGYGWMVDNILAKGDPHSEVTS